MKTLISIRHLCDNWIPLLILDREETPESVMESIATELNMPNLRNPEKLKQQGLDRVYNMSGNCGALYAKASNLVVY